MIGIQVAMTDLPCGRNKVFWLHGLSGAGKSTLAIEMTKTLKLAGHTVVVLDGDNLRLGLCQNLGFCPEDRLENVRRTAELAKLLSAQGFLVIVALMTPHENMRQLARGILNMTGFREIYVKCDYAVCAQRDCKGLYAQAALGEINHFAGGDLLFEEPKNPDLVLDTMTESVEACVCLLLNEL